MDGNNCKIETSLSAARIHIVPVDHKLIAAHVVLT
jgi:hypothetical protein